MPQATPELNRRWDGPAENKAIAHLESRGYRLLPSWDWLKPAGLEPSEDDISAVTFMFQEWDYGGIVDSPATPGL